MSHDCFHDLSSDLSFNKLNWLAAYPCRRSQVDKTLSLGSREYSLRWVILPLFVWYCTSRGVLFGHFQTCFLDGDWKYMLFI